MWGELMLRAVGEISGGLKTERGDAVDFLWPRDGAVLTEIGHPRAEKSSCSERGEVGFSAPRRCGMRPCDFFTWGRVRWPEESERQGCLRRARQPRPLRFQNPHPPISLGAQPQ